MSGDGTFPYRTNILNDEVRVLFKKTISNSQYLGEGRISLLGKPKEAADTARELIEEAAHDALLGINFIGRGLEQVLHSFVSKSIR